MDSFFFNDTATTEIYTLSLHDALPISRLGEQRVEGGGVLRCDQRLGPGHDDARHPVELEDGSFDQGRQARDGAGEDLHGAVREEAAREIGRASCRERV